MNTNEKKYTIFEALDLSRRTGFAVQCVTKPLSKLKVLDDGIYYFAQSKDQWAHVGSLGAEYLSHELQFALDDLPNPVVFSTEMVGCDYISNGKKTGQGTIFSFNGDHRCLAFEGRKVKVTIEVAKE